MISFGEILKSLRLNKNLNQIEFAKIFNVAKGTVSNWENNNRFPDKDMLKRIADYFDVSIDYLLGRDSNISSYTNELYIPKLTAKDKKDLDKMMSEIKNGTKGKLMLDGEVLDEQTESLFWQSVENVLELAKLNNKAKYTPKKYRK